MQIKKLANENRQIFGEPNFHLHQSVVDCENCDSQTKSLRATTLEEQNEEKHMISA